MAFDLSVFRELYPAFSGVSDDAVILTAGQVDCYLDASCLDGCAEYLMVAHLLQIARNTALGQSGGQITSASIDKVSVTVAQAPGTSSYSYWLNSTVYGQQLAALLARGLSGLPPIGALPERAAFRSVGGLFPRRGRIH